MLRRSRTDVWSASAVEVQPQPSSVVEQSANSNAFDSSQEAELNEAYRSRDMTTASLQEFWSEAHNELSQLDTLPNPEHSRLAVEQTGWSSDHRFAAENVPAVEVSATSPDSSATSPDRSGDMSAPVVRPAFARNFRDRRAALMRRMPLASVACGLFAFIALGEGIYILRTKSASGIAAPPASSTAPAASSASTSSSRSGSVDALAVETPTTRASQGAAAMQSEMDAASRGGRSAAAGSSEGRLVVQSEPAGAEALVDGRRYGRTPVTLTSLVPGEHRVVVRLNGRQVEQVVRIEAGSTASVVASLPAGSNAGRLAVSSPVALDILENGVLLGTTRSPELLLAAGPHSLRFVNDALGFAHVEQVEIVPAKLAQIEVHLPQGRLNVNALPWAEVTIDGKPAGETPLGDLALPIGTHEILFRHPQLGEKTVSGVIKAGSPARISVDMRK